MSVSATPAYARRRLRSALRKLRENAKLTQKVAADSIDASPSKIMRIENGHVKVDLPDLLVLLGLYGVTDADTIANLRQLQQVSRSGTSLSSKYQGVLTKPFAEFLEEEEAAFVIRHFEPLLIPGPLQTPDYARAISEKFGVFDEPDEDDSTRTADAKRDEKQRIIEARIQARLDRGGLLAEERGVKAFYLLDFSSIQRWVSPVPGKPDLLIAQIQQLKEFHRRGNVTIQILPPEAGLYSSAMRSPFEILEFEDDDEMLLFEESAQGATTIHEDSKVVADRRDEFMAMEKLASDPNEFDDIADAVVERLKRAAT